MSTVMKQSRNLTKKSCQIRKKDSFISNENMNNIKIIKSLEHSWVVIDGDTEAVEDERKK